MDGIGIIPIVGMPLLAGGVGLLIWMRRRQGRARRGDPGAPPEGGGDAGRAGDPTWLWGAAATVQRTGMAWRGGSPPHPAGGRMQRGPAPAPAAALHALRVLDGWCMEYGVTATHGVVQRRDSRLLIHLAVEGDAAARAALGMALQRGGWRVQARAAWMHLGCPASPLEWYDHMEARGGTAPWAPVALTEHGVIWHRFDAAWPVWVLTGHWQGGWGPLEAALRAAGGAAWGWSPHASGALPPGWTAVDHLAPIGMQVYAAGWRQRHAPRMDAGDGGLMVAVLEPDEAHWRDVRNLIAEALRGPAAVRMVLAMPTWPEAWRVPRRRLLQLHYPGATPVAGGTRRTWGGRRRPPVHVWRGDGMQWSGVTPPADAHGRPPERTP